MIEYDLPAQPEKFLPVELIPILDAGIITAIYDLSETTVEGIPLNVYVKDKYVDEEDSEKMTEKKVG